MTPDYAMVLNHYGFNKDFDFYEISLAYLHEVSNIFDDPQLFLTQFTHVTQQTDNFNALIKCELLCHSKTTLEQAISHIEQQWPQQLMLSHEVHGDLQIQRYKHFAKIHCLTISKHSACTVEFMIRQPQKNLENDKENDESH